MSLREYVRKRRFDETPEPAPDARNAAAKKQPIFVVQLHHARARHYDFRLEVDGALKSWAVPKGPSLRSGEKRLAVEVEDHPLSYAGFAGDIPEGHYGAGHVDIFDHGTWTPEGEPLRALAKGHLDFELRGGKLRGRWTLIRTRLQGSKQQWLLMKRSDDEARDMEADDLIDAAPAKAKTKAAPAKHGTTTAARTQPAVKSSAKKKSAPSKRASSKSAAAWRARALALAGARDRNLPVGFKPELCALRESPPRGEEWLHETKWDGYRLLADLDDGCVRLRSRNDLEWTAKFPEIVAAIEALPVDDARLDGELIALDAKGRSDFSALQRALESGASTTLYYVLFDLPAVAGVDLRGAALHERKALLEALLAKAGRKALSFSSHVVGNGEEVFDAARRHGLEGIVSKRVDAHYVHGRSQDWIKIKHANTEEFIIVGYTAPKGSRSGFGALLLATVERGALRYVGRVGSGFDDERLRTLTQQLHALARDEAVFELPSHAPIRPRHVHWVEPRIVVEIAFRGWAKEGLLRQGSFQRLREDKSPEDLGMPASKKAAPSRAAKAAAPAAKKAAPTKRAVAKKELAATKNLRAAKPAAAPAGDVRITHPERSVFPDTKITKQDVADYYRAVADWMLPELIQRPLSILRCPDGAGKTCFFQKHHAAKLGSHVASIPLKEKSGDAGDYLFVNDLHGVLELVQMNVIEFHPWGSRIDAPDQPDRLVFDLDPAPGIDWKALVTAARDVRARLAEVGLESFVRLSGGKGVHVVAPIQRGPDWVAVKAFCEAFAQAMSSAHPLTYLATASKAKREGRIFIDWLRNARGATSVASWSLRARAGAPTAMPITWNELARARDPAQFDLATAQKRAKTLSKDPWEGFDRLRQTLPAFD